MKTQCCSERTKDDKVNKRHPTERMDKRELKDKTKINKVIKHSNLIK